MYAVEANDIVKDVVIHRYPCGHIGKRGITPRKYGQVHWFDFDIYDEALSEARKWKSIGYELKHCFYLRRKIGKLYSAMRPR